MTSAASGRSAAGEPPSIGAAAEDEEPDPESVARAIALRKLNAAPQTRAQLAEAMARKNVPEQVAAKVLDRFEDVNLIDDAAYAQMLVRSKHRERGLARRGLAEELRRKGIDRETADEALEAVTPEDESQRALELVRRKMPSTAGVERQKRRRRLMSMLGRKGYGPSVAMQALETAMAEEAEEAEQAGAAD